MLGLKLTHVSKRNTWNEFLWCWFLKWSEFGFCIIPVEVVAKNCIAICIPWVSNWDMSRYLAIIEVLQKFVLISNNYIFCCDQAVIWLVQSVRLSVCPSVCLSVRPSVPPFSPCSHHHEIFRSYYHGQKWCPCKRSRSEVKVTKVNTQLSRFRTLTLVWIHIWQWNHAHSWKQYIRGALLFFKVIRQT